MKGNVNPLALNTFAVGASSVAVQTRWKRKPQKEIIFGLQTSYSKRIKSFPMLTIYSRCVKPGQSRAQVLERKPQTAGDSLIFIQGSGAAFQTLSLYPLSSHARTYALTHTHIHSHVRTPWLLHSVLLQLWDCHLKLASMWSSRPCALRSTLAKITSLVSLSTVN